jgi:hypothetical protein
VGVVERRDQQLNQAFLSLVVSVVRFQAKPTIFAVFYGLIAVTTHPGAYISRSGHFRVDNDNGQTD